MKRKLISLFLTLAIVIMPLAGCSQSSNSPESSLAQTSQMPESLSDSMESPALGGSLSILVESGSAADLTVNYIKEDFEAETGIILNIDAVPYSGVYDKLQADIVAQKGIYDVATIDVIWVASLYPGLEPLDNLLTEEEWEDYAPSLIDGGQMDGVTYAVPARGNAKIMYYREDLFNDEQEKAAFKTEYGYDLIVPETWEQVREVAKFFTRDTDNDGVIDMYGTSISAKMGGDTTHSFLDFACQAGAEHLVMDDNNEILVNDSTHVEALQFMVSLKQDGSVPKGIFEMTNPENIKMFQEGKLAFVYAWASGYIGAVNPEKSQVAGNVGITHVASGPAGYGAVPAPWYNAVLSCSKNKEAAKVLVRYLHDHNEAYAITKGTCARNSLLMDEEMNKTNPQLAELMDIMNQPRSLSRPKTDSWNEIQTAIDAQIQAALLGEIDAQMALDNAAAEIKNIVN